ncbi:8-amino-7-oxononanoate synthase [Thiolapillus sp.]
MKDLYPFLNQARQAGLYRRRRVLDSPQQPRLVVDGRPMLSFCSNDYLGLAADERVAEAFRQGVERWGSGSGAAHLVTGHSRAHHALEEELADFTGRERALLFSSGYLANLAVITSLCGRGDTVIQDRLDHASLIDGARLGGAALKRYAHNDMAAAEQRLAAATGETLLAVDGVFSMDGDLADLPALAALCQTHDAWLMVDDAHGLGVLGEEGRGSLARYGLDADRVPVLMGTLGKAFGTAGAFVAGSEALIETLIQKARSYIFTTALPAAVAEATRASLKILRQEDGRRERLRALVARFRQGARQLGFELPPSETPIQPLIAGEARTALDWSRALEARGVLVTPIRPPTVPEGSARLRITFSAAHALEDVDELLHALEVIAP